MSQAPTKPSDQSSWKHLVGLSGGAGLAWLREYEEPESSRLEELGRQALSALRQGQVETGRKLLQELEEGLPGLAHGSTSIRHLHERWYQGVRAYYEYAIGHFELAEACLEAAHLAIAKTIEDKGFLVLLANHCQEFCLHQARIARGRRDWRGVRRHIDEAAAMIDGSRPLCVLSEGRSIYFSHMKTFCESLPQLETVSSYQELFDDKRHRQLFDNFVQTLYVLPGFVLADP